MKKHSAITLLEKANRYDELASKYAAGPLGLVYLAGMLGTFVNKLFSIGDARGKTISENVGYILWNLNDYEKAYGFDKNDHWYSTSGFKGDKQQMYNFEWASKYVQEAYDWLKSNPATESNTTTVLENIEKFFKNAETISNLGGNVVTWLNDSKGFGGKTVDFIKGIGVDLISTDANRAIEQIQSLTEQISAILPDLKKQYDDLKSKITNMQTAAPVAAQTITISQDSSKKLEELGDSLSWG